MSLGGQFYREKFKPPTIQYMEEHFQEFYHFMENISPEYVEYVTHISHEYVELVKNMTENYVTYVTGMSSKVAVYLEQTVPVQMNCEQTLTTVPTNATFIDPAVTPGGAAGLVVTGVGNLEKAFLLIIGRAVNTFGGQNNLDCTTPAHNQWMVCRHGGTYEDLENDTKADGQMLDTDWECMAQGVIHPFTLMFDITDLARHMNVLDDPIGVRLASARSRQNNLIVTIDVYMKVVLKL